MKHGINAHRDRRTKQCDLFNLSFHVFEKPWHNRKPVTIHFIMIGLKATHVDRIGSIFIIRKILFFYKTYKSKTEKCFAKNGQVLCYNTSLSPGFFPG